MFRISEAANLAVHACVYMAAQEGGEPLSATAIAGALGVSETHLSKVLQQLARQGVLQSVRGARGGFSPKQGHGNLSLLDIVEAVDGKSQSGGCLLGKPVCNEGHCLFTSLTAKVTREVRESLAQTSIERFAREQLGSKE